MRHFELALHLLGRNESEFEGDDVDMDEFLDDAMYKTFQIPDYEFDNIIDALMPLIDVAESSMNLKTFKGFSKKLENSQARLWLSRIEA